jgi:hypothetical protein
MMREARRATPPPVDSPSAAQLLQAVAAAFGVYFCMYAFRRPWTAADFTSGAGAALSFKTVLVTSQVLGYTVSKFLGIRVVTETSPHHRAAVALSLLVSAELSLVAFAVVPRPWNAACLFGNGLLLGMIFGLVLTPLEGRRLTEALTAVLCASFILADGVMKSIGAWLLAAGVSETWMPAAAGGMFLLPAAGFLALLHGVRPPSVDDEEARAHRGTMDRRQRRRFLRRHGLVVLPIVLVYLVVTVLRGIRADFAPEMWRGLGLTVPPAAFTQTEIWVALGVLACSGATALVQDNHRAFAVSLAIAALGCGVLVAALLARPLLGGFGFMVLTGLGLYLPYVVIHTTVFERLLAITRERATIGFLMYVVDALGYLGYVLVMLLRTFAFSATDALGLFTATAWAAAVVSFVALVMAWLMRPARRVRAAEGA